MARECWAHCDVHIPIAWIGPNRDNEEEAKKDATAHDKKVHGGKETAEVQCSQT
jgi:hypothetical protein